MVLAAYDVVSNAGSSYLVTTAHTAPATFTGANLALLAAGASASIEMGSAGRTSYLLGAG